MMEKIKQLLNDLADAAYNNAKRGEYDGVGDRSDEKEIKNEIIAALDKVYIADDPWTILQTEYKAVVGRLEQANARIAALEDENRRLWMALDDEPPEED